MPIKTNDIKKGQRVLLRNSWQGTMADNARGNTRMVEVYGDYTETGSVYSHDIAMVRNENTLKWDHVEYTPAQIKLREQVSKFDTFFG